MESRLSWSFPHALSTGLTVWAACCLPGNVGGQVTTPAAAAKPGRGQEVAGSMALLPSGLSLTLAACKLQPTTSTRDQYCLRLQASIALGGRHCLPRMTLWVKWAAHQHIASAPASFVYGPFPAAKGTYARCFQAKWAHKSHVLIMSASQPDIWRQSFTYWKGNTQSKRELVLCPTFAWACSWLPWPWVKAPSHPLLLCL